MEFFDPIQVSKFLTNLNVADKWAPVYIFNYFLSPNIAIPSSVFLRLRLKFQLISLLYKPASALHQLILGSLRDDAT